MASSLDRFKKKVTGYPSPKKPVAMGAAGGPNPVIPNTELDANATSVTPATAPQPTPPNLNLSAADSIRATGKGYAPLGDPQISELPTVEGQGGGNGTNPGGPTPGDYVFAPLGGRDEPADLPLAGEGMAGVTAAGPGVNPAYPVIGLPGGPFQAPGVNPNELMSTQLNQLINSNSLYMRNAAQRGREAAASRGLGNSSIAAGASMRSALEAAAPIAQFDASRFANVADMGRQFQYGDAMANNQAVRQNWLDAESTRRNAQWQDALAENSALRQDWLSSQEFNRTFNAQLALMPIASSADMLSSLMQAAMQDPTVFTPNVISGFADFFQGAFNEYMGRYLGTGGG